MIEHSVATFTGIILLCLVKQDKVASHDVAKILSNVLIDIVENAVKANEMQVC